MFPGELWSSNISGSDDSSWDPWIGFLGGKYLVFVSSRSVKMRGFSFLSLYKSVFIFQFLNVKMYNYGKQNTIVNFIIKKLKKKTISSKSIKTKFSRRENLAFSVLRKVCLFFNF